MPNINNIRFRTFIKSNLLVILTMIGVILGFSVGFGVRRMNPSKDAFMWIGILGELYLNFLKMMIVPLIVSSIISGTASLDPRANGKIGLVGLTFIMATNFAGTLLGTILCLMINPGGQSSASKTNSLDGVNIQTQDAVADLLRNIIPDNLIASTFQITLTEYTTGELRQNISGINGTISEETISYIKDKAIGKTRGINMIGILVISLIFGMGTAGMGKVGKPFYKFFYSTTEIVLFILGKMLWTTPIGVCSLIMKEVARTEDLKGNFARLGIFIGTFMLALAVELFILCPLTYFIIVRKSPLKFVGSITQASLIAIAASMTSIAIPQCLQILEGQPNNIDRRITRFLVPLNAAIGRTGSCAFLAAACVFITQLENRDQNAGSVLLIVLLVTLMSVAMPSVPSGSLVTIIMLLAAIGIPPEAAALLFAFDWFSDRMRSTVNIYYQCLSSAVVQHFCKEMLAESNEKSNDFTLEIKSTEDDLKLMLCHNNEEERDEIIEISPV